MRNRFVEILAGGIGVALVVMFYLDHMDSEAPVRSPAAAQPAPTMPAVTNLSDPQPVVVPATSVAPELPAEEAIAPLESALANAQAAWETAKVELVAVQEALQALDVEFDEKEAHFAEREASGADPDALKEEMLIYLDGVVEQYDALEARLAAAETAEVQAAEQLEAARRVLEVRSGSS